LQDLPWLGGARLSWVFSDAATCGTAAGRCTASRRINRGDCPPRFVIADTAYDADHLRQDIAAKKALAVIPNNPLRALKYPLDKHLYAQRHLVECCFSKLKQFRRVATRFEKTARNYRAVVTLAAIVLWMQLSRMGLRPANPEVTDLEMS
jgi:transposase